MPKTIELAPREHQAQLALVSSAVDGVLDVVSETLSADFLTLKGDLRLLWAEAGAAMELPTGQRTQRQAMLVKARQILPAMQRAIQSGLVSRPEDSTDLAAALMSYDQDPSKALSYLRGTSNSLVKRPLAPRELINALIIHQEALDGGFDTAERGTPVPSLATIIRACDHTSVSLFVEPEEEEYALISGTVERFSFTLDVSRADETGMPYHTYHEIDASTLGSTAIGFAALSEADRGRDELFEAIFLGDDEVLV